MKSMVDHEIKCPYCYKGHKDEGKQGGVITCSGCGEKFKYQRKLDIKYVISEYIEDDEIAKILLEKLDYPHCEVCSNRLCQECDNDKTGWELGEDFAKQLAVKIRKVINK